MILTDYMCKEKKDEEKKPALKIALMHQYNDSKTTEKSAEEDCLRPPKTILTIWESAKQKQLKNKKWEEKQLYRHFKQQISEISHEKTWTRQRKGNLKRETKSLLKAAQNNAIRTHDIKAKINKTQQNSKCRLCSYRDETINFIINECTKLAQKDYKTRYNWLGKVIH